MFLDVNVIIWIYVLAFIEGYLDQYYMIRERFYEFEVISYQFLDGNIPKNLSYGVFISQLTRFANVNTTVEDFYSNISDLVNKLENQGFNKSALHKKFVNYYHSRMNNWCKFGVDIFDQVIMNFN